MKRYIELARSDVTAKALSALLDLANVGSYMPGERIRIVYQSSYGRTDNGVSDYISLMERIERVIRDEAGGRISETTILVDAVKATNLNAVEDGGSWENMIAMLILTFPEVRWLFGVVTNDNESEFPSKEHSLVRLFDESFRNPLLDPTGLRNWVRIKTNEKLLKDYRDENVISTRDKTRLAAAIDDERSYALFNAYTAYRFGCPADVIASWQSMKHFFGPEKKHGYWLLLEDMSLNFPDRSLAVKLSRLMDREEKCKSLKSANADVETSSYRILVTGQSRPGAGVLSENRDYLRHKAQGRGKVVLKPASGMFALWKAIGLLRNSGGRKRAGSVDGFQWPFEKPKNIEIPENIEKPKSQAHGAPGKLLLIAETLLLRAEALHRHIDSVPRAVQASVLANDAMELTGGRTPTTAIEALSLKHILEVKIECMFLGVEYNINVQDRFREIEHDLKKITNWSHLRSKRRMEVNARLSIATQITRIFREDGQFDEEQACLKYLRNLNRRWFYQCRPWLRFLQPFQRYIEGLIGSLAGFITSLLAWPTVFALLSTYLWAVDLLPQKDGYSLIHPLIRRNMFASFVTFFGLQPAGNDLLEGAQAVTVGLIILGFIHLGVFISHLYTMLSRR